MTRALRNWEGNNSDLISKYAMNPSWALAASTASKRKHTVPSANVLSLLDAEHSVTLLPWGIITELTHFCLLRKHWIIWLKLWSSARKILQIDTMVKYQRHTSLIINTHNYCIIFSIFLFIPTLDLLGWVSWGRVSKYLISGLFNFIWSKSAFY